MIRLSIQDGTRRQAVVVDGTRARIGRAPECEVLLPADPTVSRVHAVLEDGPHGLVLMDAGSRNGTFVNGAPVVGPVVVSVSDRIRVGEFVVLVQSAQDATVETVDAASLVGSRSPDRGMAGAGLSVREVDVLRLVAAGHTDADIAATLVISVKTVHSHLDRIRDKTGCRRRPELLRFAIEHGFA